MATRLAPTSADAGYDEDFALWSTEQAAHLRGGRFDLIDWENIAEEIESLGKSDRRAITSHLQIANAHLIKLAVSHDEYPRRGWWGTVRRARQDIADLLEDSPSLKREMAAMLIKAWPRAMMDAIEGLPTETEQSHARRIPMLDVDLAMTVMDDSDLRAALPPSPLPSPPLMV